MGEDSVGSNAGQDNEESKPEESDDNVHLAYRRVYVYVGMCVCGYVNMVMHVCVCILQ